MPENDFVIWSEAAVSVYGSQEEAQLLATAAALSKSTKSYLGLSYIYNSGTRVEYNAGNTDATNVFALVQPDGTLGFR